MIAIKRTLESAMDSMAIVEHTLGSCSASPRVFGADEQGGVPGRLGSQLHDLWSAVLAAQSEQASDLTRQLANLTADVQLTAQTYEETDDESARRIRSLHWGS